MAGNFDADVRVLICSNCGAALPPTPVGGGQIECGYCHTVTMVAPRNDQRLGGGPVDEAQRLASLWTQLQVGMQVHDEVSALNENGMLPERNVPAALQMWENVRRIQASNPAAVGDDLLWLTSSLTGFYLLQGDVMRVRAFFEAALEASRDPRHQQFLRASLCSAASRAGDDAAAAQWLSACNPQAPDLMSDTSYRVAYAYLATCQNQFDPVLQALGPAIDSIPLFFARRAMAQVLRANAYEKKGDVATAIAHIQAIVAGDPTTIPALPGMARANPQLNLCPQAFAAVLR